MRASFRKWLSILWPALFAAGIAEAVGVALKSEAPRGTAAVALAGVEVALYSLFGWMLAALALALLMSAVATSVGRTEKSSLLRLAEPHEPRDLVAAALIAAPGYLAFSYFVTLFASKSFKNQELSALLVVVSSTLGLVAALAAWLLLARLAAGIRRRVTRSALARWLPFLPGSVLALGATAWLVFENLAGFSQLDRFLFVTPVVAVLVGYGAALFGLARRASERSLELGLGISVAVTLAFWLGMSFFDPAVPNKIAGSGTWSEYAIRGARVLSDFDGDGYSSWFSGGDCAPFDKAVSPAAAEKPEDGTDNNCIGGDARKSVAVRRPAWHAALPPGVPKKPNLVVVSIETLRHDRASFLGYHRDNTPNLRALAKDALRFRRMYAAAPMTRLAVSSLFSSFAPSEIQWGAQALHKRMRKIPAGTPWLPAVLKHAGYDTFAVLTDFRAFTSAESAGFERGFDEYDTTTRLQYSGGTMHGFPAEEQIGKAIAHIDRAKRPFFLWVHLFEPHFVYEQPPGAPVYGADEQSRYDAEIWEADRQVGRLIEHLREKGELERTLFFVTGDHGEAFGEHADRWHGSNLHDPQLRPAAFLRVPGVAGKTIDEAVTFTDVVPTLQNLLGIKDGFGRLRGRNLLPLILGGKLEPSRFVIEGFSVDDGHAFMMAAVEMPYKLIYVEEGRKLELFDLEADPEERAPIRRRSSKASAALEEYLFEYLESTAKRY